MTRQSYGYGNACRGPLEVLKGSATGIPISIALLFVVFGVFAPGARAEIFVLPPAGRDLVGVEEKTVAQHEDTMPDIARRYGLGYEEILATNPGVDPWLPGEGRQIVLPTRHLLPAAPREGIVINLPQHRLYYFPKTKPGQPRQVISHPISIGQVVSEDQTNRKTPIGVTRIVEKVRNPIWYPPEAIRRQHAAEGTPLPESVPPGPDNPLGSRKMRLGVPGGAYLIHGTNKPVGVGMDVTHGCIRMYPEDIESLFDQVSVGTQVNIINSPVQTGWFDGVLYLAVYPPLGGAAHTVDFDGLTRILVAATEGKPVRVNWPLAEQTLREARGTPVAVSLSFSLR